MTNAPGILPIHRRRRPVQILESITPPVRREKARTRTKRRTTILYFLALYVAAMLMLSTSIFLLMDMDKPALPESRLAARITGRDLEGLNNEVFKDDERLAGRNTAPPMLAEDAVKERMCFAWSDGKKADEWWTHNPTYYASLENEAGFCFSEFENARKRDFMQRLYDNQFHGDCSNVITKSMPSSGWGLDFTFLADALWIGMVENRPVQMILTGLSGAKPGVWHYAGMKDGSKPICPSTDMYCYMLSMTNCAAKKDKKDIIGLNREWKYLSGSPIVHQPKPSTHSTKANNFLIQQGEAHKKKPWLIEYETRVQTWLRKEIYEYYTNRIQMQTPCTVLHVRRSDIKGHGQRKYHPIKHYIDKIGDNLHQNILLLTDDQNAIEEAESQYPDQNWMYFNRTRFRGTEGGWENHFPSGDPKTETVTLLSIFRAVRQCDSISMQKGNFAHFLVMNMDDAQGNTTVANVGF